MELTRELLIKGVRPSLHRIEVYKYLQENRIHPTVDNIYAALSPTIPTLSRTTIYNILNLFVEKGLAQNITIDPRQCRYDGDISEHAHFLCEHCGELYDLNITPFKVESEHQITNTQLYVRGICKHCLTTNKQKKL
ncbi:Fur family transcriptional regulator [Mucinivorans hirudinis]|uniref:Fur family transcriptional regulator n=1 Tax=Mucinivorans hirudinis TaxID=1433126 RepID=A0A060R947_9BACT|nr:Fur family transcriptional regulator [Mucinivorans hirudinis]